jgi:hypothetical protein
MPVESIGNPPPEAEQLKSALEQLLPDILASFNQVLHEQYKLQGIRVSHFAVVPDTSTAQRVTCDQTGCAIES